MKHRFTALVMVLVMAQTVQAQEAAVAQIAVTGEGRVAAAPDMATISLGVTTEAATAQEALRANSANLSGVLAALIGAGVAARDVQTADLALNPRWQQSSADPQGAPQITGYIASNTVTVRVRSLPDLGGVLDRVVISGANTLNGLSFGMSDPEPLRDEARRRAVADAMRKAQLYAAAAGVTLGPIRSIAEAGDFAPPVPMFRMEASDAGVPVAGGEVNLSATVSMVFAIK